MSANTHGALPELPDWGIDSSTSKPILVHKNCSVIEGEEAFYVLHLIAADRAAVEQAAGAVVKGWKLVPVEPTEDMLAAVRHKPHPTRPDGWDKRHVVVYSAMLAASPLGREAGSSDHLAACAGGGVTQPLTDDARKPLNAFQIAAASREAQMAYCLDKFSTFDVALVRAVEAAHGIKEAS